MKTMAERTVGGAHAVLRGMMYLWVVAMFMIGAGACARMVWRAVVFGWETAGRWI